MIIEYTSEFTENYRRKGYRIRRIFLKMRKFENYYGYSDLMLLNTIVESLKYAGLKYSKGEIYSAFKLVEKDDYFYSVKKLLIRQLLSSAEKRTVMNKEN